MISIRGAVRAAALIVLACALPLRAAADTASPYGSRYDNWQKGAQWSAFFGSKSGGIAPDTGAWKPADLRVTGDVNGDGMADVVGFGAQGVFVGLSNGTSFQGDAQWAPAANWQWRRVVDMTGDGVDDIVGIGAGGVYVGTSDRTKFKVTFWGAQFGTTTSNTLWRNIFYEDVDGDGDRDVVGVDQNSDQICVAFQLTNGQVLLGQTCSHTGLNPEGLQYEMADVDGDGRPEMLAIGNTISVTSYGSATTGSGFGPFKSVVNNFVIGTPDPKAFHPRLIGDFNGDGRADVIGIFKDGVIVALAPGEGARSWTTQQINVYTPSWLKKNSMVRVADVNGDGKDDLVLFANGGTWFAISQSDGTTASFRSPSKWINDFSPTQGWGKSSGGRYLADVNGDGRPDVVGFGVSGVYASASSPLYCCDSLYFLDAGQTAPNNRVEMLYARTYLPRSDIVIPAPYPGAPAYKCPAGYGQLYTIVPNQQVFPAGSPYSAKQAWHTQYANVRFMMNANFFVVEEKAEDPDGSTAFINLNPYLASVECTQVIGTAFSPNGGYNSATLLHGTSTLQALGIKAASGATPPLAAVVDPQDFQRNSMSSVFQYAVAGLQIVLDGKPKEVTAKITPKLARPRSAIGVTKDGNTLVMITINPGADNKGATVAAVANELIALGAWNAICLDGSGSAQMSFDNGEGGLFYSAGSDQVQGLKGLYRPVPVFFGIQ